MPLTVRGALLAGLTSLILYAYVPAIIAYKNGDKSNENKKLISIGTVHLVYLLSLFVNFTFNLIKK